MICSVVRPGVKGFILCKIGFGVAFFRPWSKIAARKRLCNVPFHLILFFGVRGLGLDLGDEDEEDVWGREEEVFFLKSPLADLEGAFLFSRFSTPLG